MSHELDYFQKIWVINLPERADRRREMAHQMVRIGLDPDAGRVEVFAAVRPDEAAGFPSPGARGCFMSHLQILQAASTVGLERILILEDDANFAADFNDRVHSIIRALESQPWHMFYGGYEIAQGRQMAGAGCIAVHQELELRTSHFVAFCGEAITEAAAFLDAIQRRAPGDPAGGPMHVDGAYNWLRRAHPEFRTLLAAPPLGYQRASRTDIHALRWYDTWPVVRDLSGALRRARNAQR